MGGGGAVSLIIDHIWPDPEQSSTSMETAPFLAALDMVLYIRDQLINHCVIYFRRIS